MNDVPSGTTQILYSVWGANANDIWAGGFRATILRGDGSSWSVMTTNASSTASYVAIWGANAFDVWVASYSGGAAFRFNIGTQTG